MFSYNREIYPRGVLWIKPRKEGVARNNEIVKLCLGLLHRWVLETTTSHSPPNGAPISVAIGTMKGFIYHTFINPAPWIQPLRSRGWGNQRTWGERGMVDIHKLSPTHYAIKTAPSLQDALSSIMSLFTLKYTEQNIILVGHASWIDNLMIRDWVELLFDDGKSVMRTVYYLNSIPLFNVKNDGVKDRKLNTLYKKFYPHEDTSQHHDAKFDLEMLVNLLKIKHKLV